MRLPATKAHRPDPILVDPALDYMKSKARNSKGSKKSSNGVIHGPRGTNNANPDSTSQSLIPDQDSSGTHCHSNLKSIAPEDQEGLPFTAGGPISSLEDSTNLCQSLQNSGNTVSGLRNGVESHPRYRKAPTMAALTTSMETEFIGALYSEPDPDEGHPNSTSESDNVDSEGMDSYDEQGGGGDYEDFDAMAVYEHDDFLTSQEAILLELRREQVEFEENVRQLQLQLQRQASLFPLTVEEKVDIGKHDCTLCSDPKSSLCLEKYGWIWRPVIIDALATAAAAIATFSVRQSRGATNIQAGESFLQRAFQYSEFLPRSKRPVARPRTNHQQALAQSTLANKSISDEASSIYSSIANPSTTMDVSAGQTASVRHMYRGTTSPLPAVLYPLPPDSPYRFGRKSSEFLEPVGEFHEFQSSEGNSRQVLLHVWPPSSQDTPLLQKLEACCRDFQENDVVRGHSGDGFLNGWRPSWKQNHQTGVLRFGHWRVRGPADQGSRLYPPFQTPLTLTAGGGSVLGSNLTVNGHINNAAPLSQSGKNSAQLHHQYQHQHQNQYQHQLQHSHKDQYQHPIQHQHQNQNHQNQHPHQHQHQEHRQQLQIKDHNQHQHIQHNSSRQGQVAHDSFSEQKVTQDGTIADHLGSDLPSSGCEFCTGEQNSHQKQGVRDSFVEASTQGRLLRLIRAIQMVEKVIIARNLKYLFPTLYEKYHGLQFGTPRLFDAVATVALAMDVSPRLHHDKAHTKHGFCWIVACGDFVGGDLCIPELGKRVVMRPGTVVAIRSTVVAYYLERYAKNTSMYTMYGYTSDNNWPPAT